MCSVWMDEDVDCLVVEKSKPGKGISADVELEKKSTVEGRICFAGLAETARRDAAKFATAGTLFGWTTKLVARVDRQASIATRMTDMDKGLR
ncbi:MAG: hypothetical protein SGARI_004424, partial [Bacillariaceae sp.]